MRATTTSLDNNRVMLNVEIDDEEMDAAIDTAATKLAKQVSVKGFRKGKVPKNVLIANIGGPAVLRSEAIRESMPDFYARAVAESLIDPIGQPDINITAGEEEGPVSYTHLPSPETSRVMEGFSALRAILSISSM